MGRGRTGLYVPFDGEGPKYLKNRRTWRTASIVVVGADKTCPATWPLRRGPAASTTTKRAQNHREQQATKELRALATYTEWQSCSMNVRPTTGGPLDEAAAGSPSTSSAYGVEGGGDLRPPACMPQTCAYT